MFLPPFCLYLLFLFLPVSSSLIYSPSLLHYISPFLSLTPSINVSFVLSFIPPSLYLAIFLLPSPLLFLSLSLHQEIGDGAEEEAGRRGEEEEGGGGEEDSGGCWVCHCRHPADRSPLLAFVVLTQELFADGSLDGFIYLRLGLGQRCKITYWAPEMTLQKWFITAPTAVVCLTLKDKFTTTCWVLRKQKLWWGEKKACKMEEALQMKLDVFNVSDHHQNNL